LLALAGRSAARPGDAEVGPDENVETLDLEVAAEFLECARDQAHVDTADDARVGLREVVERTAVHVDLSTVRLGCEAFLIEEPSDLGDRLVLTDSLEPRWAADEKASPRASRLCCALLAVGQRGDRPGQDRRQQAMLVAARCCNCTRPQPVAHPRAPRAPVRGRRSVEEPGVVEDAQVP